MADEDILELITKLADEEHRLERSGAGQGLAPGDQQRLVEINVRLDQCWDLLRQRRARRAAGQDPDLAAARDETVVERFEQ